MAWKLLANSIHETKTAAGHFATGYRGRRWGRPGKPRGSVKVGKVGKYWGVFDKNPDWHVKTISLARGKMEGKRLYG